MEWLNSDDALNIAPDLRSYGCGDNNGDPMWSFPKER